MNIAVASGKGGTGKTFLATNLFFTLQQKGYAPTLVDCDAEEPNAALFLKGVLQKSVDVSLRVPLIDVDKCTFCGKCQEACSYHAIFIVPSLQLIRVLEEFCHGCGACTFMCKEGAIHEKDLIQGTVECYLLNKNARLIVSEMKPGVYSPVKVIQSGIREAGNDNLVILDAPPGIGCPVISTITGVGKVVIVTEPSVSGIHDIQRIGGLCQSLDLPVFVIINKYDLHPGKSKELKQYCDTNNFILAGKIPYDPVVVDAMVHCQSINEWAPDSIVASAVERAYQLI